MAKRYLSKIETYAYLAKKRLVFVLMASVLVLNTDLDLLIASKTASFALLAGLLVTVIVPLLFWLSYAASKWRLLRHEPPERPCRYCGYELKMLPFGPLPGMREADRS